MLTLILISIVCSTTGVAIWKTIEVNNNRKQLYKLLPKILRSQCIECEGLPSCRCWPSPVKTCICGHTVNQHTTADGGHCGKFGCSCYNFTALTKILQSPIRNKTTFGFGL